MLISSNWLVHVPVQGMLSAARARVLAARSGREGAEMPGILRRLGQNASLVILDMAIEEWAGLMIAAMPRSGGYNGAILGLVNAAPQSLNGEQACIEAGCNGVLIWPDEASDLVDLCKLLLARAAPVRYEC